MIDSLSHQSHGMTVDIRLCGNLTRKEVNDELHQGGSLCGRGAMSQKPVIGGNASCAMGALTSSQIHRGNVSTGISSLLLQSRCLNESVADSLGNVYPEKVVPSHSPGLEAPMWAKPAKGEAWLEPVCESIGRQTSVDLTKRSSFRLGRSPNSDIQLVHATSSRKHAIIFHHSNGSCYVVDCGSAHGTFVNSKRISSPSSSGVVVPHKVRRGAIIRFGGPGAPCFVLKSFSFKLSDIQECPADSKDMGVLVRRNTRMNALGVTASEKICADTSDSISLGLNVMRKRSFDSLCSTESLDDTYDPFCKRMRCSSPPLSPEVPLRLVSPDYSSARQSKPRRVTFSLEPPQAFYASSVTPDEPSSEGIHCDG